VARKGVFGERRISESMMSGSGYLRLFGWKSLPFASQNCGCGCPGHLAADCDWENTIWMPGTCGNALWAM